MVIPSFFLWWYGAGWRYRALGVRDSLARVADTFSVGLLLKTLFVPFKQLSSASGSMRGRSFQDKIQILLDKMLSRVIGAIVRTLTIFLAIIILTLYTLWGIVWLAAWPLLPLLPVAGLGLMITGWVPTWL